MTNAKHRKFSELSTAEKIVSLFQTKITEAHREAIEGALGIDSEQFSAAIRDARDIGIMGIDPRTGQPTKDKRDKSGRTELGPLYLTQVYERKGWWTCRPTARLVAISIREGRKRNLSEAQREVRLYDGAFGTAISYASRSGESGIAGALSLIDSVPEMRIAARSDYVLADIDQITKPSQARLVAR